MKSQVRVFYPLFSLIVLAGLFLVSGCSLGSHQGISDSSGYAPFIPPTLVPTALPTATPSPTQVISESEGIQQDISQDQNGLAESDCTDQLMFVSDITIPDGTSVVAGSTLDKQWEVENSGSCNWNEDYQLRLISGPAMGAETEQKLIPARSGSRVTLRIVFTAPDEPGVYRSAWQAYNPQSVAFGDLFFIDIVVE